MPVALLAPLGHMHLEAAEKDGMGSIVIGTRAPEALEAFEGLATGGDAVLLYSSLLEHPVLEASWSGTWGGWQYAVGNGVPPREWRRLRGSLMQEEDREAGFFIAFYLVEKLHRLERPIPLTDLTAVGTAKPLAANFAPRHPLAINR